ncbi:hypothetical protein BOM_0461 [Borrelia miyamotoi FR64b]|nr:hypothetical protein BOM_0461 [Borrelia miyamotoi FR64b]
MFLLILILDIILNVVKKYNYEKKDKNFVLLLHINFIGILIFISKSKNLK